MEMGERKVWKKGQIKGITLDCDSAIINKFRFYTNFVPITIYQ